MCPSFVVEMIVSFSDINSDPEKKEDRSEAKEDG